MKQQWKRVISVLLSLVLTAGLAAPAVYAAPAQQSGGLEFVEIDPQTLNVPRLGAAEEEADLTAELPPYGLQDRVRVSIVLDEPATLDLGCAVQGIARNESAMSYRAALLQNQKELADRISREVLAGEPLEVRWNITLAGNMISALVPYGKLQAIRDLEGVAAVELEQQYEPMKTVSEDTARPAMVNARDMVGADGPEASRYNGAGRKVAIIDTGLDWEHQSFDEAAFLHAIEEDGKLDALMTAADIPATGLNGRGVYLNAKIPYAYNYVDNNTTVNHTGDTQEEHGSHVTGIAAANRYLKQGEEFVSAAQAVGVVGEAPDAQVFVMKVFGSGGGAYDSDILVAIEDAMLMGADSVNLSLGSSNPGGTYISSASYRTVFNNLVGKDIVVSISMGNNTSWDSQQQLYADDVNLQTGGSPGSYTNSLCVASIDDTGVTAPYLLFNGSLELRYLEGGGEANNAPMTSAKGSYQFVYVDDVGTPENFAAVDVSGKVAICNRGTTSFYEKANAAVEAGAVAVIIVNNQPGTISMALDGYSHTAPCVSIKQAEGAAIRALGEQHTAGTLTYYTGAIEIGGADELTPMAYFQMSSFSSWGVPGTLELKPEITAPGGMVNSLNGYHRNASGGGYSGGHDQYEYMSGTSMAAPQIAGLSALMGQYYADNGLRQKTGLSLRTFVNSLLMSTAVPVLEEDSRGYYSILDQGAGLANVNAAVSAKSYILMDPNATVSYADGKVKAELGDDPFRSGEYSYSFTLHNFSDAAHFYSFRTDLFTQALEQDNTLMSHLTASLDAQVTYTWELLKNFGDHDVNKDGVTDGLDAQAILDRLTGSYDSEAEFDEAAADLDGDEAVTSYDAYLFFGALQAAEEDDEVEDNLLPPGRTARITVRMVLTDGQKAELDALRAGGAYLEGFTFVESETDPASHSIPILGFYGSWTDASMFNAVTYAEAYYGSPQTNYFTANNANGWYVRYNGSTSNSWFLGNPYVKEESWPADRLALNSDTVLYQATYTLIRNVNYTGFAVIREGEGRSVLYTSNTSAAAVTGAYYNTQASTPSWQATSVRNVSPNKSVASLGLTEGDRFTFGFFALPEYYAKRENGTATLSSGEFNRLLTSGELGRGAYLGYTVTLDNTAPVIDTENTKRNEDGSLTVAVRDNQYIANLRIMDLSGRTTYASVVPQQTEPGQAVTQTFTFEGVELGNAVTIFAADYAGNEVAMMVRIAEGDILIERDVYVRTGVLADGKDYLIVNTMNPGSGYALTRNNTSVARTAVTVNAANGDFDSPFIKGDDVTDNMIWTAVEASDTAFKLTNGGYYLRRNNRNLQISTTDSNNAWTWDGENNRLSNSNYYLRYSGSSFSIATTANSIYIYERQTYTEVYDENKVESVTVTPASTELFTGGQVQLQASLLPVTLADKSVSWSSSNEEVATVDQNGLVTAVGAGTANIIVTPNCYPSVTGSAAVTVTARTALDAEINAQVVLEGAPQFVKIDLNDLSMTPLGDAAGAHYGGGRSGNVIIGFMSNGNIVETDITEDGYSSAILGSFNTTAYNARDGAHIPSITGGTEEETITETYASIYLASNYLLLFSIEGSITGWNFSGYSAIAYAGTDAAGTHYYYMLNNSGQLLSATVGVDEETPITVDEETGEHSLTLTLSTSQAASISGLSSSAGTFGANYMSMSVVETEELYGLLIANTNNRRIYFVDLTADTAQAVLVGGFTNITGLTTLYDDNYDVNVIPVETEGIGAQLMAQAAVGEKRAAMPMAQLQPAAGTQSLRDRTDEGVEGVTDPVTVVEITADEMETTNGLLTVAYDSQTMTLVKAELNGKADYDSIAQAPGSYAVAFVDLDASIEAEETVLTLYFQGTGDVTISVEEMNRDFEPETETLPIGAGGPAELEFGEPVWTWSADYSLAIATFTSTDGTVTRTVMAQITAETTPADYGAEGEIRYTAAAVFNDVTYYDYKTVVLPALPYTYGQPEWSWNEELTEASAVFTANEDETVTVTLPAAITVETTPATDYTDGLAVYTASVEFQGQTYTDVRQVILPKPVHECPCAAFEDMPEYGTPEHEAIDWAFANGITAGMDETHFGTGTTLTRAQTAAFLWAASGRPEIDEEALENPFSDVKAGLWYTKYVLWAYSQGLVSGYENGTFRPNNKLSRAEILQLLYAWARKPSVAGMENPYTDVYPGRWYSDAAIWAYDRGLERGENGIFSQAARCTRECFVLYLYRYLTGNALAN